MSSRYDGVMSHLEDETSAAVRLGVWGLGAMGEPMAQHLLGERGALTVHARLERPSLTEAGAT